jgi:hypothetical protein
MLCKVNGAARFALIRLSSAAAASEPVPENETPALAVFP